MCMACGRRRGTARPRWCHASTGVSGVCRGAEPSAAEATCRLRFPGVGLSEAAARVAELASASHDGAQRRKELRAAACGGL